LGNWVPISKKPKLEMEGPELKPSGGLNLGEPSLNGGIRNFV